MAAASATCVSASRKTTSVRGTSTSRICRLPASKTSPTMCRSSWLSVCAPVTRSRSSSSVMAWRPTRGSPPSRATIRLVHLVSSQTTGRAKTAIRSSSGAASRASAVDRGSAIRLGASSPRTRLKNVMQMVTTMNATVPAQVEDRCWRISQDLRKPARVSAPYAPENKVARVTPICTAEKNRFGSWASRAARWPRLPRLASALTWPSRSETRAISEPAKNPPMRMMMRTTMTSRTTLLISLPLASGGARRAMCLASLDGITYVSRGHAINLDHLEIQHPAGGRAGDRLLRRGARARPRPDRGHPAAAAADAGPAAAAGPAGLGDPKGPAGRGVGGDRGGAPGPDLPAARRPVPARPVRAGAAHRDTGGQLRRGGGREPLPLAGRTPRPVRGGLLHPQPRLLVRRAVPAPGQDRARGLDRPDAGARRAARDQAGVLLREPGRGDRRHAAPPARADLRVPVRGAEAGPDGDAGPRVRGRQRRREPVRRHGRGRGGGRGARRDQERALGGVPG